MGFNLNDVADELRAMSNVCDEHMLGLRELFPWQQPLKKEELECRKKVYAVAIQILEDRALFR